MLKKRYGLLLCCLVAMQSFAQQAMVVDSVPPASALNPNVNIQLYTGSKNIYLLDRVFKIPQLANPKVVWIYLPNGYADSKMRYPVMYVNDDQSMFDSYNTGIDSWGVINCMDSLIASGKPPCIVVGMGSSVQQITDPTLPPDTVAKNEASSYVDFLVQTLKPFIDKNFRTIPSQQNTIIAGTSIGGVIAYYMMLQYPRVFGKAGVFSPTFWMAPQMEALTDSVGNNVNGKLFFYVDEREQENDLRTTKAIVERLGRKANTMIYSLVDPQGRHDVSSWRKWFPEFYKWAIADGYNYVIKLED